MKIGLISDTHGNLPAMDSAIEQLQNRSVDHYLHCGDVGAVEILDYLAGLPAGFVWGNCDWDKRELEDYARNLGITCHGPFADLTIDGKTIALMHGDDHRRRGQILADQHYDYLLYGHTHMRQDTRVGKIHVINPGALHRAREKTAAILDLAADSVEFIHI